MRLRRRQYVPLTEILPGDTLHLDVPPNRHLTTGKYEVSVDALSQTQTKHEVRYQCSFELGDTETIAVHFRLSIPKDQSRLSATNYENPHVGCAFLGNDEFPVMYTHEPNLTRRLAAGNQALATERTRTND